jgi:hypothetical protein
MLKYDPLYELLKRQVANTIILSFQEIERIISKKLPPSSDQRQWWENSSDLINRPQAKAWINAGFKVEDVYFYPDPKEIYKSVVTFERIKI